MGQQSVRQVARRAALEGQAARRKERAEHERRVEALVLDALLALGERDSAIRDTERRAGQALRAMTDAEGLSLRDTVEWCGGAITVKEAARLRRLAMADNRAGPTPVRRDAAAVERG